MVSAVGPELIGTVGFPIAAVIGMYRLYREERADRQQERRELRDERASFRDAIEGHTEAVRALTRRIDQGPVRTDGGEDAGGGS